MKFISDFIITYVLIMGLWTFLDNHFEITKSIVGGTNNDNDKE